MFARATVKVNCFSCLISCVQHVYATCTQVSIISPGEVETAESAKFYELLGISDPASFTPAEPPAETAAATAKLWALEYTCEDSEAPSGWPLLEKGAAPRREPGALLDSV